jgi:hypothetical protein
MLREKHVVVLLSVAYLVGCSRTNSLSHDELKSEFRASISLAAEAESFVDHLREHDYSRNLIEGHLSYLAMQASEQEDKLARATTGSRDEVSLDVLRSSNKQLAQIFRRMSSDSALRSGNSSPDRFGFIRRKLEAEMPR